MRRGEPLCQRKPERVSDMVPSPTTATLNWAQSRDVEDDANIAFHPEAWAFLNHLRFVAMECRVKPRTDLFEACAFTTTAPLGCGQCLDPYYSSKIISVTVRCNAGILLCYRNVSAL